MNDIKTWVLSMLAAFPSWQDIAGPLADWLEEHGDKDGGKLRQFISTEEGRRKLADAALILADGGPSLEEVFNAGHDSWEVSDYGDIEENYSFGWWLKEHGQAVHVSRIRALHGDQQAELEVALRQAGILSEDTLIPTTDVDRAVDVCRNNRIDYGLRRTPTSDEEEWRVPSTDGLRTMFIELENDACPILSVARQWLAGEQPDTLGRLVIDVARQNKAISDKTNPEEVSYMLIEQLSRTAIPLMLGPRLSQLNALFEEVIRYSAAPDRLIEAEALLRGNVPDAMVRVASSLYAESLVQLEIPAVAALGREEQTWYLLSGKTFEKWQEYQGLLGSFISYARHDLASDLGIREP